MSLGENAPQLRNIALESGQHLMTNDENEIEWS